MSEDRHDPLRGGDVLSISFFTTKKRGQGTGLGLWIVVQLVRSQGGEIQLVEGAGPGTIVCITWPEVVA